MATEQRIKQETAALLAMIEEARPLLEKYGPRTTLAFIGTLLPSAFCLCSRTEFVSEAVDRWRVISAEIEQEIRHSFGRMRHGEFR